MGKRLLHLLSKTIFGKSRTAQRAKAAGQDASMKADTSVFNPQTITRFPIDSHAVDIDFLRGSDNKQKFFAEMRKVLVLRFGEQVAAAVTDAKSAFYDHCEKRKKGCRFKGLLPPVATAISAGEIPVNANNIFFNGVLAGIAMQAPTYETLSCIWPLVVQHDIRVLVDLTTKQDRESRSIPDYRTDECLESSSASITRADVPAYADSGYSAQVFQRAKISGENVEGSGFIHALHFKMWSDFGTLSLAGLHSVVRQIREARKDVGGTIGMHCTAGIGRTGTTFSAMELERLYRTCELTPENYESRVLEIVADGRLCRGMHFVQTHAQLRLLFDYAEWLLKRKYGKLAAGCQQDR